MAQPSQGQRGEHASETIGDIGAVLPTSEAAAAVPPPAPTAALLISLQRLRSCSEMHPPGSQTRCCHARSPPALPWGGPGGTDLPCHGAAACTLCKARVSQGHPCQEPADWASGAAGVTHGDPQAFPPSAAKLRCSLPKVTSMRGFLFSRVFFFTVQMHPRVHSTKILMITLPYCCFVGLTALKT